MIAITGVPITNIGVISTDGATDGQVLTADGAGGAAWAAAAGPGYLEYVALLTQSGTNAPVATVLKNTLGGTVVWSRTGAGLYLGTLNGAFTENKTFILPCGSISIPTDGGGMLNISRLNNNDISVEVVTDGVLGYGGFAQPIEIRVYP